jgi:predicted nucleic-acid-binding Zn-ribbon protein
MINLWHKFIDWKRGYFDSAYCKKCGCCGEEGCCSVEKSLLGHNCKYGEYYAKEVYYNEMLIDELLKLLESKGVCRDETGDVVIDPIGDAYDRAYYRALEKYGK